MDIKYLLFSLCIVVFVACQEKGKDGKVLDTITTGQYQNHGG